MNAKHKSCLVNASSAVSCGAAACGSLLVRPGQKTAQSAGNGAQREQIRRIKSDKVAFHRLIYFFADFGGLMREGHVPRHAVSSMGKGARSALVQAADFSPVKTILQPFKRFFTPFLSCKRLVSRRLWNNHGFFKITGE
jgi:hypothetical protein